jgi:hypothetical protein
MRIVLLCVLCGQKDSVQRMLIMKCFLFTVGSVCRIMLFTTWRQMFRWWRRCWNGDTKVAETTFKILLCCGFRRTGKAMGQVYQCWCRIHWEINCFRLFEHHMLYVLCPFVTHLLTLPRSTRGFQRNTSGNASLCHTSGCVFCLFLLSMISRVLLPFINFLNP